MRGMIKQNKRKWKKKREKKKKIVGKAKTFVSVQIRNQTSPTFFFVLVFIGLFSVGSFFLFVIVVFPGEAPDTTQLRKKISLHSFLFFLASLLIDLRRHLRASRELYDGQVALRKDAYDVEYGAGRNKNLAFVLERRKALDAHSIVDVDGKDNSRASLYICVHVYMDGARCVCRM